MKDIITIKLNKKMTKNQWKVNKNKTLITTINKNSAK